MVLEKLKDNKPLALSDLSQDLTEDEVSAVSGILARHHSVPAGRRDAEEYIEIIEQEAGRLSEEALRTASEEELMKQLQTLRERKK